MYTWCGVPCRAKYVIHVTMEFYFSSLQFFSSIEQFQPFFSAPVSVFFVYYPLKGRKIFPYKQLLNSCKRVKLIATLMLSSFHLGSINAYPGKKRSQDLGSINLVE